MKILWSKSEKAKQKAIEIGEFCHAHKDLIIIIADPADDTISVMHQDRYVAGRIRSAEGDNAGIVRDLMKNAHFFDSRIDRFLLGLADVMKIKRMTKGINNVLQFIDGALLNLATKNRKAPAPQEGAVKSPFIAQPTSANPAKGD